MSAIRRALAVACLGLTSCAMSGLRPDGVGSVLTQTGQSLTPQAALDRIVSGTSSKATVSAALGTAIVIPFDSGYEVWVYRWPGADRTARAATELVILFGPSGLVDKVRLRPGYETGR